MITFVGDVFLKDPVAIEVDLSGLLVMNLESPLTQRGSPHPRKIVLRGDPHAFDQTFRLPPAAVSLSNNHVMDWGVDGFEDTLAHLDKRGIACFGAGTQHDRHRNPAWLEDAGLRVAMLGYASESATPVFSSGNRPGAARFDLKDVRADIAAAKREGADRVAVHLHWGAEHVHLPSPEDVASARAVVDAGADIVIGHHAHCIQAFERYRDRPIFYGLGNFVFPSHASPTHFDDDGIPGRIRVSRSFSWNRASLVVTWNPISGATDVFRTTFVGGRVRLSPRSVARHRLHFGTPERYAVRFRRAYAWGKLRQTMAYFLAEPKLPSLRHVRAVRNMLRARTPT